jgi:hypothetical protein
MNKEQITQGTKKLGERRNPGIVIIDDDIRQMDFSELSEEIEKLPEGIEYINSARVSINQASCTRCVKNKIIARMRVFLQKARDDEEKKQK